MAFRVPARILERLARGRHRINDEIVDLALLFWFHPFVRLEGAIRAVAALDLAGDLAGQVGDVEFLDSGGAAFAFQDALPSRLDAGAERRNHSEAGDHDSTHSLPPATARAARISRVAQA